MRPETAGFSSARLARLDEVMTRRYVEGGYLPGMLIHIYRKGQLVHTTLSGHVDLERGKPMREDAIFRIYSMSKPITAVALMMLVEEGLLGLDDPSIPTSRNGKTSGFMRAACRRSWPTRRRALSRPCRCGR